LGELGAWRGARAVVRLGCRGPRCAGKCACGIGGAGIGGAGIGGAGVGGAGVGSGKGMNRSCDVAKSGIVNRVRVRNLVIYEG